MSHQEITPFAALVLDTLEFAREARVVTRELRVTELPRLLDSLSDSSGSLQCELRGGQDHVGDGRARSWLHLRVTGVLQMQCQRCLQNMQVPLEIDNRLVLMRAGEVWPDEELEDDSADAIPANEALVLKDLIEDEVLLALPIVPRHERCDNPLHDENKHALSPFAALAQLKKH